jgi:hypothetical protein
MREEYWTRWRRVRSEMEGRDEGSGYIAKRLRFRWESKTTERRTVEAKVATVNDCDGRVLGGKGIERGDGACEKSEGESTDCTECLRGVHCIWAQHCPGRACRGRACVNKERSTPPAITHRQNVLHFLLRALPTKEVPQQYQREGVLARVEEALSSVSSLSDTLPLLHSAPPIFSQFSSVYWPPPCRPTRASRSTRDSKCTSLSHHPFARPRPSPGQSWRAL